MSDSLLNPPATPLQRIFDALGILGLVGCVAPTVLYWSRLPDTVPTHFGFAGRPDAWGEKSVFVVVSLLGVLVYASSAVMSRFVTKLEKDPRKLTPRSIALQREFLAYMKVCTLLIAWTLWAGIQVALGRMDGLGNWVVPAMFAFVVILCVMAIRIKRDAATTPLPAMRK